MPRARLANGGAPERRGVHSERAEKTDMTPALQVFADTATLIDSDREVKRPRVKRGFQADGPGAQNGNPWRIDFGHLCTSLVSLPTGSIVCGEQNRLKLVDLAAVCGTMRQSPAVSSRC